MATDRILVHENIAAEFVETLRSSLAKAAAEGSPLPVVATTASKARIQKLLAEALSKGASVVCGSDNVDAVPGASIIPTVLQNVDPNTSFWNEEVFGPLVAITTVKDEEEAIRIANKSEYGLSGAVFTKDLRKAFAIAKQLQTG